MAFASIPEALEELARGRMIVVVDDEDRENEGDLVVAAQFATPQVINFMAKHACGLVCLALTPERCAELGLELMVQESELPFQTAFTTSIEARRGVTTGISAHDRARTVQVAIDPASTRADLVSPGHMFPLRARPAGVFVRAGHTEAAVDLARLAGLHPAGVICEVLDHDGSMARVPQLIPYCRSHRLKMITVADLIAYRREHDRLIERAATARLPTSAGAFTVTGYRSLIDNSHCVALINGDVAGQEDVLVRLHSECVTGDILDSLRCDCGQQLTTALDMIAAEPRGVLVYLAQEGRGIGLLNKLRAYQLQDQGLDTVNANLHLGFPVDARDYRIAAQVLDDLDIASIRLMTDNPTKLTDLKRHGIAITNQISTRSYATEHNRRYLQTKIDRLGHTISADRLDPQRTD